MIAISRSWSQAVRALALAALVPSIACADPAATDPATPAKKLLPPMSLSDFGPARDDAHIVGQHGGAEPETYECRVWWANGEYDNVNALNSQELTFNGSLIYSAVVADDFFLQFGKCYVIDSIEVEIAAAYIPGNTPDVQLRLFEDCNGKPAAPAAGFQQYAPVEITDLGAVAGWPDFTRYRVRFEINQFSYGYRRLWLAPVGQGQGLYYWLTANSGTIQGAQGQYKAPQNGFPNWTDTDDITQDCPNNDCWDHCTDFAFRICGKCCWLLKDTSEFDTTGLSSIAFANNVIWGTRAVDNFQVPPGDPLEICRIEAWMATNCGEAFMEIYDNLCDSPTGEPIVLTKPDREALPGVFFSGLQVYRYSFTCPDLELEGGRNYWLSMAALGVGTPHERAIWLFRRKDAGQGCHICITQGQWRSFFLGFPEFTPVSNPALAGEPREFAMRIYAAERYDDVPPTIISKSPEPDATGEDPDTQIVIEFDERLSPATVNDSTVMLLDEFMQMVAASIQYDDATRSIIVVPQNPLNPAELYTVKVRGGLVPPVITDTAGNPLIADCVWSFSTAVPPLASDPPQVEFARFRPDIGINDFRQGTLVTADIDDTCFEPNQGIAPSLSGPHPIFDPDAPEGVAFGQFSSTLICYGACTTGNPNILSCDPPRPDGDAGIERGDLGSYAFLQGSVLTSTDGDTHSFLQLDWYYQNGFFFGSIPGQTGADTFDTTVAFCSLSDVEATLFSGVPTGVKLLGPDLQEITPVNNKIQLIGGMTYRIQYNSIQTTAVSLFLDAPSELKFVQLCVDIHLRDQFPDFQNSVLLENELPALASRASEHSRAPRDAVQVTRVTKKFLRVGGTTDGGMDDPTDDGDEEVDENFLQDAPGSHGLINGKVDDEVRSAALQFRWFQFRNSINTFYDLTNTTFFDVNPPLTRSSAGVALLPSEGADGVRLFFVPPSGPEREIDLARYYGSDPSDLPQIEEYGRYKLVWTGADSFKMTIQAIEDAPADQ